MAKLDNILVYHWQAWRGFLISHLVADYCMVEATYDDDFSHLQKFITPNIQAVLLQINLSNATHFPAQKRKIIEELESRNILVLNKEVEDIRKAHLHQLLQEVGLPSAKAPESGPDDEQLFVKSNLNWGGQVELRLPENLHGKFVGTHKQHINRWDSYYKIKRGDVATELWQDPGVVIERYISNQENSFYRVYCFGDALVIVKAHSDAIIKKISQSPRDRNFRFTREQLTDADNLEALSTNLPKTLLTTIGVFLRRYPLAWFCLDILHNQQQFYIVDLNLTPWSGEQSQTEKALSFLSKGGQDFIKNGILQRHPPVNNSAENTQIVPKEICHL